jgi:hypothetical protein
VLRKRRKLAVVSGIAILGLAAAGIAYATIPDSGGVIHGCYDTKTGALRVIDAGGCVSKEAALNWNQTGPQGPQGIQGVPGPQGPAGVAPAWARIDLNGNVTAGHNVAQWNVSHPQLGVYCIGGLTVDGAEFDPLIGTANGPAGFMSDGNGGFVPNPNQAVVVLVSAIGSLPDVTLAMCPDTAKVRIETYSPSQQQFVDRGFSIILEG